MKRIIPIIIAILSLSSCITEQFENVFGDGEQLNLKLSINTRASGSIDEDNIEKVRIMAFKENGNKAFSKIVTPVTPDGIPLEYQLTIVPGRYNFVVVCNETSELTVKLNAATTRDEVDNATFDIQNPLQPSFVMYGSVNATVKKVGEVAKVDYGTGDQDRLNINMKRIAAKASISLIKNSATIKKISNLKVSIVQRPAFSLLGEDKDYKGVSWIANQELQLLPYSASVLENDATYQIVNSGNGFLKFDINGESIIMEDIYIPENTLTDPTQNTRNTYLEITAKCELAAGTTTSAKWRIDFKKDEDYGVKRNHHYHILAKIQDVGAMDLYAEILPVSEVDIEIGWGLIEGLTIVSDRTDKYGLNEDVWNNFDKLTGILKVYTSATESMPERYQDVVFKYGSILAVESDNSPYSADKILWSPPDYVKPMDYASIPYIASGDINAGQINGTNLPANVNNGIGDPCRLVRLSKKQIQAGVVDNYQWRMMTQEEMARLITANDAQDPSVNYIDSRGYYAYHSWLIPKTIARDESGSPVASGDKGFYWTAEGARAFTFTAGNQGSGNQNIAVSNPNKAGTIRCIRTSVPERVKSVMTHTVSSGNITYQGGVKEIQVTTNIPYWTAQLTSLSVTERTTGVSISPAPSFDNFSFHPANTNVLATTGMNSATLNAYIKRYESNTHNSVYKITITGFGYDGQTLSQTVTVTQIPFDWVARVMSVSGATGISINGAPSVRQAGETLSAQVKIDPQDVPLPIGVAIGLKVDAYFTTVKIDGSNNTIANLCTTYPNINNLGDSSNRLIWVNNIVVDVNIAPNPRLIFVTPDLSNLPYITNVRMNILQEAN